MDERARPSGVAALWALLLASTLSACEDPYADWPAPGTYFPYVYTPQADLQDYEKVRWESGTFDLADAKQVGLYLLKLLSGRLGAPTEELAHFSAMRDKIPTLGQGVRLSLVGDVMWVGGNWKDFARPSGKLLDGDLRVGNLETPTSPDHSTAARALGLYAFNAPVEMLQDLPLHVLQLNNNHSLDAGDVGLENTVREVKKRGYKQVGIDSQASLQVQGHSVALLSYTWGINDGRRSQKGHELHIVPFGQLDRPVDLSLVRRQVGEARAAGAGAVVVLLHWGFEYELYPDPHFMVLGRRIIEAGADLVVGQGPHVAQPAEICHVNRPEQIPGTGTCSVRTDDEQPRTAAILYSLGDFGTTLPTLATKVGLVATASLDAQGVTGLGWAAVVSQDLTAGGQSVVPLSSLTGEQTWAEEQSRIEAHLGRRWKR